MANYDYVVVGGGTAGCVVAARLSEDPSVSVLLLEAGGDERRPDVEDPNQWAELQSTDADWGFETEIQLATGRAYPAPRGRVLGGSGSINCLAHLRGHASDFDGWATEGWDYEGVLPYFRRSEHVPHGDPRFRGLDGPLRPRAAANPHPLGQAFVQGALAVGHRATSDLNGAEMIGAGYPEMLVRNGRRESTATAYLRPATVRPNLSVVTDAHVLGLTIRGDRCHGVEYTDAGGRTSVSADEVVLCAGAIGSPHLLMLSGIGPVAQLAAVGVATKHDMSGVGRNLQDHVLLAGIRYRASRPITSTGMEGSTLFAESDSLSGPDLHLSVMNLDYHLDWQSPAANSFTFAVGHMRPQSRGSVRLRSHDPHVAPQIDPGYLTERIDLDKLVAGIEKIDEIVQAGAFNDWGGGSDTTELLRIARNERDQAVREAISSYFHLAGTCRMGTDEAAVVDGELRVHGIRGLRVADASIMPTIVSSNTNAATVMIGEKAADLLLGRSLPAAAPGVVLRSPSRATAPLSASSRSSDPIGRCHGW